MNKLVMITLLAVLILTGCEKNEPTQNFKISSTVGGETYRLNTESGEVFEIKDGSLVKIIKAKRTKLIVGKMYDTENGQVLTYIGNGVLKEKPLSEYTDEELLEGL